MKYTDGDLLTYPCNYVVHQCNCITTRGKGLADAIFKKWPQADSYKNNTKRTTGTVDVVLVAAENKYIVNLYGQRKPAKCDSVETWQMRLRWFEAGLVKLEKLVQPNTTVAFPYLIGCGLAGGNWIHYEPLIKNFSDRVEEKGVETIIVRLE
jgi:O-acetyl-ADP-ribose deacetylase (regulator of RNase III)